MHPFLGMTVSVEPVQRNTAPAPAIGVRAAGQPPVLPGIAWLGEQPIQHQGDTVVVGPRVPSAPFRFRRCERWVGQQ